MSSSDLMVSVRGLSKSYTIRHNTNDHTTIAELALDRIKHPFHRTPKEEFWALQNIDFDVQRGEVLGLIGRNGAGKSTLLKVLTRITEPTMGRIDLWGRVGCLLEVGTGFHPELTGRENVYLNGSILGMSRREITKQFDAIVDFAGVERFLDTPVKRYSSGMYVRLAFAVAAHLETEILLVDEVLAVGDTEFQQRCLGKMRDVAVDGRTVLFVSHHMPSIDSLCDRCLLLNNGEATAYEGVGDAIASYSALGSELAETLSAKRRTGTGEVRIVEAAPSKSVFECGEEKVLRFTTRRTNDETIPYFVSAHIVGETGDVIAQCDSRLVNVWGEAGESTRFALRLQHPWLRPGSYRVDLFVCSAGVLEALEGACRFVVSPILPYPVAYIGEALTHGQTLPSFSFETPETPQLQPSSRTVRPARDSD